ncbi:hypothetical protein [Sphingomonas sp. LR55]
MTSRTPIASIAVLGAGIVGLSAAIAFARAAGAGGDPDRDAG